MQCDKVTKLASDKLEIPKKRSNVGRNKIASSSIIFEETIIKGVEMMFRAN
jgi:hypothetical protein